MEKYHGTTILCVRKNGKVDIGSDGQVSTNSTIMKGNAKKIRRLFDNKVIVGFAGATADAFTLYELFEKNLQQYSGNILLASINLAKKCRSEKALRNLNATMIASDSKHSLVITGNGDVIQPEHCLVSIGSGGDFARSAAQALVENTNLSAREIVEKSLLITSNICLYTNSNIMIEELESEK